MKKILLSVLAVISFSLLSHAQFKVGIKAGSSLDNQRINVTEGTVYGSDSFKGYYAGLTGDMNIGGNFYLQPQLLYNRKGATHLSSIGEKDIKVRMSYVELPVNVLYKADVSFGKVFAGAGATFSYAVGGKEKQGGVTRKLYSGAVKDWRREDLSLNFTAGLEFNNGIFVSINSQKGLLDIHKADGISVKNRLVSVGYLIDWNKFKRKI